MIIILKGPPFAGKETQSKLLSEKFDLPVFSMGEIIRDAYSSKNPKAIEAFEKIQHERTLGSNWAEV